MLEPTYELGYEDKQIVNPDSIDISKFETDRDFIVTYALLSKAARWRDSKKRGTEAHDKAKQIVDEVRTRLERVGWHAHIFKTGSCECNCKRERYLYVLSGLPQVSEVPFSDKTGVELEQQELFNKDGSLREMPQTLELLKIRIGKDILLIDEMLENDEITEDVANTVKAIMKEQDLEELHELDQDYNGNYTMCCGSTEWTWRDRESEAEEEVREYLEDGELWRMAVEAEQTIRSLDDWIEEVINIDGWQSQLCRYDGCSYELPDGKVYWRTN